MGDLFFLVGSAACVYLLFMHDFTDHSTRDLDYIVEHPETFKKKQEDKKEKRKWKH